MFVIYLDTGWLFCYYCLVRNIIYSCILKPYIISGIWLDSFYQVTLNYLTIRVKCIQIVSRMVSLYFRWDYPAYFVLILCERGAGVKFLLKNV